MADVGNHPESTQAGYNDSSPLSDLAQSIVSRFHGPRSMLSPWIQRTLADRPASTETGEPRQISLSGRHTDRLLNKVQRQTAESQVWQPDIGSLKPDFVDRFATNIVERFPATGTKYEAQPLTSASSEPANLVLVGDPAQPVSNLEEPGGQPQSSSRATENWPTLADLQRAVEAKANWTPASPAPSPPPTPVQRTTARPTQSSQPASPSPASPPGPRRIFSRVEEVTPSGTTSIRTRSPGQEEPVESESVQKKEDTVQTGADDSLAETRETETPPSGPSGPEISPVVQRQPDQPRPIPQPGPESQPEVRSAPDKPETQTPSTLPPTEQPLPPDRPAGSSIQRQPDQPEPSPGPRRTQVEEIGGVRAEDLPSSITEPDLPGPAVEPETETSQAAEVSTSPPVQRTTGQKPPTQAEPPLSATRPEREVTTSEPRQMAAEPSSQSVQRQSDGEIAPQTQSPSSPPDEAGLDRSEIVSLPDHETEPASRTPGEEATAGPTEETLANQAVGKSSPQTVQRQVEQETITSQQPETPQPDRPDRWEPVSRAEQLEPSLKETPSSKPSPEPPVRQTVQRQPEPDVPSVQPEEIKPDRPESSSLTSKGDQPEAPSRQTVQRQPEPDVPSVQPEEISSGQPEPDVPSVQPEEIKPDRPELSPLTGEGGRSEVSADEAEVLNRMEELGPSRQSEAPSRPAVQRQPEPDVPSIQPEFVRPERATGEVARPGHRPTEPPSPPGVQRQADEPTQPERPAPVVEDRPASSHSSGRPEPESQSESGSAQAVQRRVERAAVDQFEAVRPQVEGMEEVQQPPAQAETRWPEVGETEPPQSPEAPAASETGPMISVSDSYRETGPLTEAAPDLSRRAETAPGVQRQLDPDLPAEPGSLPVPPRSEGESVPAKPSVDEDVAPAPLETSAQESDRETQPTSSKVQRQLEPEPGRPQLPEVEAVSPESPAPPASGQEPAARSSTEAGDLPAESPAQSHPSESPVQRQPDEAGTTWPGLEEDILARASSKANLPLAKPMSPASRFNSRSEPGRNGAQSGSLPSSQGRVQARFERGSAGQTDPDPLVLNRFRPPAPQGTVSEVGASWPRSGSVQRTVTDPFPAPRDLPLPPVYRAPATDQSAGVVQRDDETSETGAATGTEAGASGQDLDKLAREVYPIIKRLLAVERERVTGLLRRR